MIYIKRTKKACEFKIFSEKTELALDGTTKISVAEKELLEAIDFYTRPQAPAVRKNDEKEPEREKKKEFKFRVYKNKEILNALKAMFGEKCAYCEYRYVAATDTEIEHFRPKAEVRVDGEKKPGYFWLAGDWDNLLASCKFCNQKRDLDAVGLSKKSRGKGNQFPLRDESKRAGYKGDMTAEEAVRLLLNPCIDDPELHLTYDEKALIYPRKLTGGKLSDMGEASIEVYNLQRSLLVDDRKEVLLKLNLWLKGIKEWIEAAQESKKTDPIYQRALRNIEDSRGVVEDIFTPKSQFLGMLRWWVREGVGQDTVKLLKWYGIDLTELLKKTISS